MAELRSEDKEAIKSAKGPSWKKVLLWVGVVLLVLTGITVIIVMFLRKTDPASATKEVLSWAETANAKADVDAKIMEAEARFAEDKVVDELEEIREIEDEKERLRRLADMF